jgi:hypothetical protein
VVFRNTYILGIETFLKWRNNKPKVQRMVTWGRETEYR